MTEHNTTEQWKDIQGYEGLYQVSNMGKIRSLRSGIRLINPNNRTHVCLYDQWGKPSYRKVCRIVAETFLPRKRKCNYIYHINQIPCDNRAENLRWATLRECHRTDRERYRRSVRQLKDKSVLRDYVIAVPALRGVRTRVQSQSARMFRNIATAASDTGIPEASIYLCCAGKKPTAGGYKWYPIRKIPREVKVHLSDQIRTWLHDIEFSRLEEINRIRRKNSRWAL